MRLRTLALGSVIAFALTACEESPTTTGNIAGPLEGPRVAESYLALDVVDGAPAAITDSFTLDDIVNLWIHWTDLDPPHEIEIVWWDPLDNDYSTTLQLTENVAEQVTVFTLQFGAQAATGRWEVEIWIDGEFMRSLLFDVEPVQ